jgi:putative SOS response-associated peptidase YedK
MCASAMQAQAAKNKMWEFTVKVRTQMDGEDHRIIYPLQPMAFGRLDPSGDKEALVGQFGLVPEWVTDAKGGPKYGRHCYNARKETIFEKPSFRTAILMRRAVVPVTSFFEFPDKEVPLKHRYKISRKDGQAFWLAAIWEHNHRYNLDSVSVITTTPMNLVEKFHSRSPVILADDQVDSWLNTDDRTRIDSLLDPVASGDFALETEDWNRKRQPDLF